MEISQPITRLSTLTTSHFRDQNGSRQSRASPPKPGLVDVCLDEETVGQMTGEATTLTDESEAPTPGPAQIAREQPRIGPVALRSDPPACLSEGPAPAVRSKGPAPAALSEKPAPVVENPIAIHSPSARPGRPFDASLLAWEESKRSGCAPKAKPIRILIADDDSGIRQVLRRVLCADLRADVREVSDGLGVLEALTNEEFDVAIIDIEMGLMNGTESLEAIRSVDALQSLPVIMISGAADVARIKQLKALGVMGVIAKPFSLSILRERLLPLISKISPVQPSATAATSVPGCNLCASSRIFVVGADEACGALVQIQLGTICNVSRYSSAVTALRELAARPPDIIFITSPDPMMPPSVFARAVRRGGAPSSKLILCGESLAEAGTEGERLFDASSESIRTPAALARTLRSQLTDRAMMLFLLQTGSPVAAAVAQSANATFGAVLGEPVRLLRDTQHWNTTKEAAIEVSLQIVVDRHAWRLTAVVTQQLAVRYASSLADDDTDLVSHAAAVEGVTAVTRELASVLCRSLADYGISGRIELIGSRTIRWCESEIGAPDREAHRLWFAASGRQTAIAAAQIVPWRDQVFTDTSRTAGALSYGARRR